MVADRHRDGRRERITDLLNRLASRKARRNPRTERLLMAVAGMVFVAATVIGFRELPDIEGGISWLPLGLVAIVAVPFTVVWNAIEYVVTGRLVDRRVPMFEALRVSVLSSAANLLPVPGAVVVRSRALSQLGTGLGAAVGSTAIIGLAWLAMTFVAAGAFLLPGGRAAFGAACLGVGVLGVGLTALLVRRRVPPERRTRTMVEIGLVETGFVAVLGIRMYLVLLALGYGGLDRGFALALAAVVATASGFFPGGFGLREVLAGAISPLIGLPAAVGVVVAAVDRLVGLVVLALATVFFTLLAPPPPPEEPVFTGDDTTGDAAGSDVGGAVSRSIE